MSSSGFVVLIQGVEAEGVMAHSPAHGARLSATRRPSRRPASRRARARCSCACSASSSGCSPSLARRCTAPETIKSVVVLSTDGVKVVLALFMLAFEDRATRAAILGAWTLADSLTYAAVPAALYALQNWLCQLGYQQLDSLTYNLLNQTKTLSAALNLYLFLGRRQSATQVFALGLLLTSAAMLTVPPGDAARARRAAPDGARRRPGARRVVPLGRVGHADAVGAAASQAQLVLLCSRRRRG